MLEKRLRILLIGFALAALVLVARLVELQVVRADYYRRQAKQAAILAPQPLPFVRGAILDRFGEVLVSDDACWNLKIDFSAIAAHLGFDDEAARSLVRRLKRENRYPDHRGKEQILEAFQQDCRAMWGDLAWFAAAADLQSHPDFRDAAQSIFQKVKRIRSKVARYRGFDAPIVEERQPHTLISGLTAEQQILAREIFDKYSWIRIEPASSRRFVGDGVPFAHVVGRLASVSPEDLADDVNRENPFAKYEPDDQIGVSGVEWLAEQQLRGRRGRIVEDRDGAIVEQIDAENGEDVRLTLHAGLQRRMYQMLGDVVRAHPDSSGGTIVVLDVATREVLALVSFPSFDPNEFDNDYQQLREDTDRLPLVFRTVATRYAPGSTIKPLSCLAGLIHGAIDLHTRENCTGYLFEDSRESWRCWEVHGTGIRKAHGSIDVIEALTGSCNIFMYRLGERLGIDRLCAGFEMGGVGKPTGIGLREENVGINPTPSWLMSNLGQSVTPGLPRLYAMGQGEIAMTPLQVVNLMATYANGKWRPVKLRRDGTETPEWTLPASSEQWSAIRRGIFGVTNDPEGTAYKYAHFEQDGYVICGKTGSATTRPWPTSYRIGYRDDQGQRQVATVRAGAKGPAMDRFRQEHPSAVFDPDDVEVAGRWPPNPPSDGENHAHAWFGGYLQAVTADGRPDLSRPPRVAFSILVEFGGSGGQTSGPLAKEVAAELLRTMGPTLDPDHTMEVVRR